MFIGMGVGTGEHHCRPFIFNLLAFLNNASVL